MTQYTVTNKPPKNAGGNTAQIKNLTVSELRKELKSPNTFAFVTVRVTQDDEDTLPITKAQMLRLFEGWDGDTMTVAIKVGCDIIL